jgi:hypothetical protein
VPTSHCRERVECLESMCRLWWIKRHWERFFSISLYAVSHQTTMSHFPIHSFTPAQYILNTYRTAKESTKWHNQVRHYAIAYLREKSDTRYCHAAYHDCQAVPLQGWSGPEGSRKLRFPEYMTTAQDGGKVVSLTHRPLLPPGNALGTHFC